MRYLCLAVVALLTLNACTELNEVNDENQVLPILGFRDVSPTGDTIYHTIPSFSFINQDSQVVNNATFDGKVYVVDLFFIHCPSICPKVSAQMLRIHEEFIDDERVALLAHTVDPKRDTVLALRKYANALGVERADKWHFVTGDKDEIYDIADEYLMPTPGETPDAPGGFDHSGRIILVDKNRRVRSFAQGTDVEEVTRFIRDIKILLKEG